MSDDEFQDASAKEPVKGDLSPVPDAPDAQVLEEQQTKDSVTSDSASSVYEEESKLFLQHSSGKSGNNQSSETDGAIPEETLEIPEDVLEQNNEDEEEGDVSIMPLVLNEEELGALGNDNDDKNNDKHDTDKSNNILDSLNEFSNSNHIPDRLLLLNTIQLDLVSTSKEQVQRNLNAARIHANSIGNHLPSSNDGDTHRSVSSNFLLESRASKVNQDFHDKDIKSQEIIVNGTQSVQKTFNDIKSTVGGFGDMLGYKIDWELWTEVVNNYQDVVTNQLDKLNQAITQGIPKEFRGIIWQLVSKAKNLQLEELYLHMKSESLVHEKAIKRDLTRTLFFTSVEQVGKSEELFNVIKTYSLFDPDVGYTQGMIFIAVPLVMNMTDSECFSLLVTLMKEYDLRSLFCPDMRGLHLLLYQFDRLLELYSPKLYNHLVKQGVKLSMYALQWFLTFFAYKFPLDIVLRIYDVVITSGMELILKFALNLMIKNETNLIALKFDKLLEFLKDKLFNYYVNDEYIKLPDENTFSVGGGKRSSRTASVSRRFSLLGKRNTASSTDESQYNGYYKLNQLVSDSMEINVLPEDLQKYEIEFDTIYDEEIAKGQQIEDTKIANGKLRHEIKELEQDYTALNRDHVDIIQKMIDLKVIVPEIVNDNSEIESTIEGLKKDLEELELKITEAKEKSNKDSEVLPSSIEDNIHELLRINADETEKYANLEDEYETLLEEERKLDQELEQLKSLKKWIFGWR